MSYSLQWRECPAQGNSTLHRGPHSATHEAKRRSLRARAHRRRRLLLRRRRRAAAATERRVGRGPWRWPTWPGAGPLAVPLPSARNATANATAWASKSTPAAASDAQSSSGSSSGGSGELLPLAAAACAVSASAVSTLNPATSSAALRPAAPPRRVQARARWWRRRPLPGASVVRRKSFALPAALNRSARSSGGAARTPKGRDLIGGTATDASASSPLASLPARTGTTTARRTFCNEGASQAAAARASMATVPELSSDGLAASTKWASTVARMARWRRCRAKGSCSLQVERRQLVGQAVCFGPRRRQRCHRPSLRLGGCRGGRRFPGQGSSVAAERLGTEQGWRRRGGLREA